jgi:HPt (histidine-containing phosphotransfer) domain-containing protein
MTANAMEGDRETCLAAGMDDYLSKPIRAEQLLAALDRTVAASRPQDEDPVDASVLEQLEASLGEPAVVAELVDTFLRDAPKRLAALRDATTSGDSAELRRAAHTLKSNAQAFGAGPLAELCRELENAAKTGLPAEAAELVGRIEAEYGRVEGTLARLRPEVQRG